MKKFNRIFMIVTDSLGIGPDSRQEEFGDKGANTLLNVTKTGMVEMPTWKKLGIGHIAEIANYKKSLNKDILGYVGKIEEISNAKDTLAGHWEMVGIITTEPNPQFIDNGFPEDLLQELSKAFDGRKLIGNKNASGTEILKELGDEANKTGAIIVYTSPDSTLQICGSEEYLGLDNLYRYSKAAREICSSKPEWNVARIIARPYVGENGQFTRTFNRHDYANKPPKKTILNELQDKGVEVIGVGKINDIFVGQGIDKVFPPATDNENMDIIINLATQETENQFIFTNLVQFDSDYGHRRNIEGYAQNISNFDIKLTKLINAMKEDDLLIITSDHGNDPSFPGYSHTRETLPLTIYSPSFKGVGNRNLGQLKGLATAGNIVAENFGVKKAEHGESVFDKLI